MTGEPDTFDGPSDGPSDGQADAQLPRAVLALPLVVLVAGALLFTMASTAFGLVVSAFVRSQIAAILVAAIIVMIPTVNFSGMMYPVSTLEGGYNLEALAKSSAAHVRALMAA